MADPKIWWPTLGGTPGAGGHPVAGVERANRCVSVTGIARVGAETNLGRPRERVSQRGVAKIGHSLPPKSPSHVTRFRIA